MCDPIPAEKSFSEEVRAAVGLLFLTSAAVENQLGIHVARLMAHPNKVTGFAPFGTSGMDASVKLITIQRAIKMILPAYAIAAERICTSIRRQFETRNNIAHCLAGPTPNGLSVAPLKLTSKGVVAVKGYPVSHILRSARVLHARANELGKLLKDAGVVPMSEYFEREWTEQAHRILQSGPPNRTPPVARPQSSGP